MTYSFLGPDPVEAQVYKMLALLSEKRAPNGIERTQVDVKEEPGRRMAGRIIEGQVHNDEAARFLADEMACMANTEGGGSIILGIADDGQRIGTNLDGEWLRHRLYELTERRLTVSVRPVDLEGTRLLVLSTHESIEPVRYRGKVKWRVGDHCVEVDPTTWHQGKLLRSGVDWSAQPSGHTMADASAVALELARRYARSASGDLAAATDEDLLRRLNVVTGDGRLTNAGSLMFVETPVIGIDYIHRVIPAGDSTARYRERTSLLEQVSEADRLSAANNRSVHVGDQFARGQFRALPSGAVREAIVNGVVHRDWLSPQPTVVEHIGDVLTVTSPGGLIGGIRPSNIITHPSVPRYRSLAEAMSSLALAEREGVGVDRMVRDMLAVGHSTPEISEVDGPYVRVGLIGGAPDPQVVDLLAKIDPQTTAADVDALLLVNLLCNEGWFDGETAAPVLQRPIGETTAAILRLAKAQIDGRPIIGSVSGVPHDAAPAWHITNVARSKLSRRVEHLGSASGRLAQIQSWARARKRVSASEVVSITGVTQPTAGKMLSRLADDGFLAPIRENRLGRGFYYTLV